MGSFDLKKLIYQNITRLKTLGLQLMTTEKLILAIKLVILKK